MPDRRKSQQAEREYEKIKSQLEGLEESVRDRCKKEFTGRDCPQAGRATGFPYEHPWIAALWGQKLQESPVKQVQQE